MQFLDETKPPRCHSCNTSSPSVSPGIVALASPEFLGQWLLRNNLRYLGVEDMVKAVFCLSKSFNQCSPPVMENNYPAARKVGAKGQAKPYAFSQFLPRSLESTWRESGDSNRLLVGEAYTNAAVNGKCMLCSKDCPGKDKSSRAIVALRYGIPACPSCWKSKEARLDMHGIDLDMVPLLDVAHMCHTKKFGGGRPINKGDDRKNNGPPVCGTIKKETDPCLYFFAVKEEFVFGENEAVAYPREKTLKYYLENNKDEIESARQTSKVLGQPAKDVDEWSDARRTVDLKRQIERESGKTLYKFLEDIPSWLRPYCFRFVHGEDCIKAAGLVKTLEGVDLQPHFKSLWDTGSISMETLLEKVGRLSVGSANDVVIRAATEKQGERSNTIPCWLASVYRCISSRDDCTLLHEALLGRTSVYNHFFNAFRAEKEEGTGGGDGFFHGAVSRVVRDASGVAVEVAQSIIQESMMRLVRQEGGDTPSSLEWLVDVYPLISSRDDCYLLHGALVGQTSGVHKVFFDAFRAEQRKGTGSGNGFFHGAVSGVVCDASSPVSESRVAVEVAQSINQESMMRLVRRSVKDFPSCLEWLVERTHSFASPTEFISVVQELARCVSGSAEIELYKKVFVPAAGSAKIDVAATCREAGLDTEFLRMARG